MGTIHVNNIEMTIEDAETFAAIESAAHMLLMRGETFFFEQTIGDTVTRTLATPSHAVTFVSTFYVPTDGSEDLAALYLEAADRTGVLYLDSPAEMRAYLESSEASETE